MLKGSELTRDLAAPLRCDQGWKILEYNIENPGEEEWHVCTVSIDADDEGRACDYGHSILEGIKPVVDSDREYGQIKRALSLVPEMIEMIAHLAASEPDGEAGKRAMLTIDFIRAGESAYLDREQP